MTQLNSLYIDKKPEDCRVVVAMSGGVDSSVVAALLKDQGYDVIGITLQLYDHGAAVAKKGACCAGQDIHDARRVAEQLDIPHYVLNYEDRFSDRVVNAFADSYIAGETPVPCILCNQEVKFKDLLETALDLEADVMATGHYIESRPFDHENLAAGFGLYQPIDSGRDQSYFLFSTSDQELSKLRFPLGGMTKADVRALAQKYELGVADKADSQDICFVPQGSYADVIEKLRPGAGEEGDIFHIDGRVLGRHNGIIHYTIGQRRGLGIASGDPLYVIRLDPDTHQVIVGPREALLVSHVRLRDLNWLGSNVLQDLDMLDEEGIDLFVKVRSTRGPYPAKLMKEGNEFWIELINGEDGVALGQACVLYSSDDGRGQVLGGGWICETRTKWDVGEQEPEHSVRSAV